MAANKKGGGDSPIDFPLYLYSEYCEDAAIGMKTCYRNADETSLVYYDYLYDIVLKHGVREEGWDVTVLDQETLESLGIEVYFDDYKITGIDIYMDDHQLDFTTENFYYGSWRENGEISLDIDIVTYETIH